MSFAEDLARVASHEAEIVEKGEKDELGINVEDTPEYIVARIRTINAAERSNDRNSKLLYTKRRKTELWLGNEELAKNKQTIYRLAKLRKSLKDWELDIVWDLLLNNVPYLDDSIIVIDDYTYWDINNGVIGRSNKPLTTV